MGTQLIDSFLKAILVLPFLILSSGILLYAPELNPASKPEALAAEDQSGLNILSWNIAMLPIFDFVQTGKNRADRIGSALQNKDFDLILFQEAFTWKARRDIYRNLRKQFPFQYGPANTGGAIRINSGLWILSRIPLKVIREYQFSATRGLDRISRKGAVLLQGTVNDQVFHIIGTHLDSNEMDPTVRFAQLNELKDNLIEPYSNPGIPMIICGDFNTDRDFPEQYKGILQILDCEDGTFSGEDKTTFGFLIDQESPVIEKPRQLDYIFIKNSTFLKSVSRKVSIITETIQNRLFHLSDHHGIEARILFKQVPLSQHEQLVIKPI
jgi:phospholipase C